MAFVKVHGIRIAQNGYIENVVIENLATDPTTPVDGQIWFNSTLGVFKAKFGAAVKTFANLEDLASTAEGEGIALVGYAGHGDENENFSVAAGTAASALDAIVDAIDGVKQEISDLESGTGGELDALEGRVEVLETNTDNIITSVGLEPSGTFLGWDPEQTSYLETASSIIDAIELLDAAAKAAQDGADDSVKKAGDVMTGTLNMSNNNILNLANPIQASDAANKYYVDSVVEGLVVKGAVRAATTENITLSGEQTVDGVALVTGDRVLVKSQGTASENGIYVVAEGVWERAADAVQDNLVAGSFTFVTEGTTYDNMGFVLATNDPITVGETALEWSQFSGAGQIQAGIGLSKDGNWIHINLGAGIGELPTDFVGVDVLPTGGLWTTETTGTSAYDGHGSKLGIKLNGNTLALSANGLKVANWLTTEVTDLRTDLGLLEALHGEDKEEIDGRLDDLVSDVGDLQAELDATQAGAGLEENGAYSPDTTTNYIASATSLMNADFLLDAAIKANADAIAALELGTGGEIGDLQALVDAVIAAAGLTAELGTYAPNTEATYISEATSLANADDLLDAALSALSDEFGEFVSDTYTVDLAALQSELDATQLGAGLEEDGTFAADTTTNYVASATSLKDAIGLLDAAVKANYDAIVDFGSGNLEALQDEMDATQAAVGLNEDGTYLVDTESVYTSGATTVLEATSLLSAAIVANDELTAGLRSDFDTFVDVTYAGDKEVIDGRLDDLEDLTEAIVLSVGLNADGTFVGFSETAYLDEATDVMAALAALDAGLAGISSDLDSAVFTYASEGNGGANMTHTIVHGLDTDMVEVQVWVKDDDDKYKGDLVGITVEDNNTVVIDLTEAREVKVIVRK
jgi:hypothetical protein